MAAPVLVGDRVAVAYVDQSNRAPTVVALELLTGNESWRWKGPASGLDRIRLASTNSTIAVASNGSSSVSLFVLNSDGKLLWQSRQRGQQVGVPALNARLLAMTTDQTLQVFEPATGNRLWSGKGSVEQGPAISGPRVVAQYFPYNPYARDNPSTAEVDLDTLRIYAADSGKLYQALNFPGGLSAWSIAGDHIYAIDIDEQLSVYSVKTSRELYTHRMPLRFSFGGRQLLTQQGGNQTLYSLSEGSDTDELLIVDLKTGHESVLALGPSGDDSADMSEGAGGIASAGSVLLVTTRAGSLYAVGR